MEDSLRAWPFLIFNLSGEMLYILDQRLRAQSVQADRANKVREDIVLKLVEDSFLKSVFNPQKLSSYEDCKNLFQGLAHSSILKLNPTSMGKLFDLMVMGVKMQTLCIKYPDELYKVALNHLNVMSALVNGSHAGHLMQTKLMQTFNEHFYSYRPYQFAQIRRTLLDFFLDNNTRVSLFLSQQYQHDDGNFSIDLLGEMPPGTAELPGTIKKLGAHGRVIETTRVFSRDYMPLELSVSAISVRERGIYSTTVYGENMYADSKPLMRADSSFTQPPPDSPARIDRSVTRNLEVSEEESKLATNWELDILADFTGVNSSQAANVALQLGDLELQPEADAPVSKPKVSNRLSSLKAQFKGFDEFEEAPENESNFFG
jgi:hypothetical protein